LLGASDDKPSFDDCNYVKDKKAKDVLRSLVRRRTYKMYYVYILQSKRDETYYVGVTDDLKERVKRHNSGSVSYTSGRMPYKLIWYCVFLAKKRAYDFEKYLKSGSGNAFFKKRFI
jgi:predicted GIY-YIG superfamily endonuclease